MLKMGHLKHQRKCKTFSWPREQSLLGLAKMVVLA
jgi:hypothetical protein